MKNKEIAHLYLELSFQALELVRIYEASRDAARAEYYRQCVKEYIAKHQEYADMKVA